MFIKVTLKSLISTRYDDYPAQFALCWGTHNKNNPLKNALLGVDKIGRERKRIRANQPSFDIKIDAINKQLPGTAEILNSDFSGETKHDNIQLSIRIINDRIARNLIVFNKFLTTSLKTGERWRLSVAYEESEDLKKWPSRVFQILHSEYEDKNGVPSWFNICYQDEDGHNMVQSVRLRSYEDDIYYELDGYPWEA